MFTPTLKICDGWGDNFDKELFAQADTYDYEHFQKENRRSQKTIRRRQRIFQCKPCNAQVSLWVFKKNEHKYIEA